MTTTTTTDTERDTIRRELGKVARRLARTNAKAAELYAERLRLFQAGRALTPPITQRELADTAKVSEEAVIQVLRKAKLQGSNGGGA